MSTSEKESVEETGEQIEVRRQKLARLREAGHNFYPNERRKGYLLGRAHHGHT